MNNIAPVNYNSFASFKNNSANQPKQTLSQKIEANNDIVLAHSPLTIGLMNAACWSVTGFIFDRLISKLFKTPTNPKISIALNGAIGAGFGIYSYCQAAKLQKAAKANPAEASQSPKA